MAASIFAKTATASGTLQGGRTRLKGFTAKCASGSPAVVFKDGASGATLLSMVFTASQDVQINVPDHGMIFANECHVTITNIDSITGFFG